MNEETNYGSRKSITQNEKKQRTAVTEFICIIMLQSSAFRKLHQEFQLQAGSSLVQNDTGGERPTAG